MLELENASKPIGKSGTLVSSGIVGDEYIQALSGAQAAEVYARMEKSDYQVQKVLAAVQNPIKAATPSIEPASEDAADIQIAKVIEQILLKDMNWNQKLNEILTFIPRGHSVFEVVTMNKQDPEIGPYTGLAQLGFRDQSSLEKWLYDKATGDLLGIEQKQQGDIEVDAVLDSKFLVIFFNNKRGDDNGFPLLRPLYGPYKRKLMIEELKMIGIERSAIPIPVMTYPADVKPTDEQYQLGEAQLRSFTSGQDAFIMTPQGWAIELNPQTFDPTNLEATIKSEDTKMSGALLAMFVELGTGGNAGSLALSENLEKFFTNGIVSFANVVMDTINGRLIPFLCRLNFGDTVTRYPKLNLAGIGESAGKTLMEIVTGYSNARVITPDPLLEDHIRKVHKLPKRVEGAVVEDGVTDDPENPEEGGGAPPAGNAEDPEAGARQEPAQLKEAPGKFVALAEKPSTTISKGSEEIAEVMREKLDFVKAKLINDIMRYYRQLPEGRKVNAIKSVSIGGQRKFKDALKGALARICAQALRDVREEVPTKSKVKLSDNVAAIKALDPQGVFKFDDFSRLPKHVQLLLELQAKTIADKMTADLSDRVSFQFMQSQTSTDSADLIEKDITDAANNMIEAGAVDTAALNVVSTMVNETRGGFFFDPEVLQEIASFTFVNADPKSDICRSLAGMVFETNDAEALRYNPPLHHNCKSYLRANLKSSSRLPTVTGLPPISEGAKKSITFSEKVDFYNGLAQNCLKGCSHND